LIFALDLKYKHQKFKNREAMRQVLINFFKIYLGFTNEDIQFVDRSEFDGTPGKESAKFSADTIHKMNEFARPIFKDTKYGLAKQVLNIAICECYGENYEASNFFKLASNFELTIELFEEFNEANAREYFDFLALKIKSEEITEITFKESNDFFFPDLDKGILPF
jgi:hypothetical protein